MQQLCQGKRMQEPFRFARLAQSMPDLSLAIAMPALRALHNPCQVYLLIGRMNTCSLDEPNCGHFLTGQFLSGLTCQDLNGFSGHFLTGLTCQGHFGVVYKGLFRVVYKGIFDKSDRFARRDEPFKRCDVDKNIFRKYFFSLKLAFRIS